MTATTTPAPRPLCAAFAPLLPLISSGALEEDEAPPTREHVAECAWCQQELARYMTVDEALRPRGTIRAISSHPQPSARPAGAKGNAGQVRVRRQLQASRRR